MTWLTLASIVPSGNLSSKGRHRHHCWRRCPVRCRRRPPIGSFPRGPTRPCGMLFRQTIRRGREAQCCPLAGLPARGPVGVATPAMSRPRPLIVEWSGAARSRPSSRRTAAISPSVCWRSGFLPRKSLWFLKNIAKYVSAWGRSVHSARVALLRGARVLRNGACEQPANTTATRSDLLKGEPG
jgi:hypothetical protein